MDEKRPDGNVRERLVENTLRREIEQRGGLCLKWVSPGNKGVQDRLCLMPGGVICFVECKRPTTTVKRGRLQEWWQTKLTEMGFWCEIVHTQAEAKELAARLAQASAAAQGEEERE